MIQVHTLTDGGQTSPEIAHKIADFVNGARETLELALYDIRLHDETAAVAPTIGSEGFVAQPIDSG